MGEELNNFTDEELIEIINSQKNYEIEKAKRTLYNNIQLKLEIFAINARYDKYIKYLLKEKNKKNECNTEEKRK